MLYAEAPKPGKRLPTYTGLLLDIFQPSERPRPCIIVTILSSVLVCGSAASLTYKRIEYSGCLVVPIYMHHVLLGDN